MKKIYLCKNNTIDGLGRTTCNHLDYQSSNDLIITPSIYNQCNDCPHFERNNSMRPVKITYTNGDTVETNINGTDEEIKEYYKIGRLFNIGSCEDNLQAVVKLEFLKE